MPELGKCILSLRLELMLFCPQCGTEAMWPRLRPHSRQAGCPREWRADRQATSEASGLTNRYGGAGMSTRSGKTGKPEAGRRPPADGDLGPMPVWNLADLYPGPESEAVRADLERAGAEAKRIQERYQGKLAAMGGAQLAEAVAAYEGLSDTLGKLGSYAGLLYAADTSNPDARQVLRRHPGEAHRHHHRPDLLRAGAQQDRRRGPGAGAAGAGARPLQALARRPAQGEALPARGEARAAVPREIDHLARLLEPPVQRDHDGAAASR